jgi:signal recognition particle subunit SEC65
MPDHFYVYPTYLDKGGSRSDGRRIPASGANADVTVDEIVAAARALGFTATAEPDKQYSRSVSTYSGRVKVAKKAGTTKTAFLHQVAREIERRRPAAKKG